MKKRTNVRMTNSGINPLKHLWGQTSWVGSSFDHSVALGAAVGKGGLEQAVTVEKAVNDGGLEQAVMVEKAVTGREAELEDTGKVASLRHCIVSPTGGPALPPNQHKEPQDTANSTSRGQEHNSHVHSPTITQPYLTIQCNELQYPTLQLLTGSQAGFSAKNTQFTSTPQGLLAKGHRVVGVFPQSGDSSNPRYTEIVVEDRMAEMYTYMTKTMMEQDFSDPLVYFSVFPELLRYWENVIKDTRKDAFLVIEQLKKLNITPNAITTTVQFAFTCMQVGAE
jgi:hypothetical protein